MPTFSKICINGLSNASFKMIEPLFFASKFSFIFNKIKPLPGIMPFAAQFRAQKASSNRIFFSLASVVVVAPNKEENKVTKIMSYVKENQSKFYVPAGQSTQMIIGATKETDLDIMTKSEALYKSYALKRVFYSAYIPVNKDKLLPMLKTPPLVRENRLYQADWLLRFYGFNVKDLLDEDNPNFNILMDPKANWALRHLNEFPKEINTVSYYDLLKVPGIGIKSAKRIIACRKNFKITFNDLKKMGVVIKRAKYFITCNGKYFINSDLFKKSFIEANLILEDNPKVENNKEQLSLFS